jgi:GNAT superfamily N-acetyltransferase
VVVSRAELLRAGAADAVLAAAVERNALELWRILCAHIPGAEFHEDARGAWFVTGIRAGVWYNQILRANLDPEATGAQINRALAPFRERGLEMLWTVGSSSSPPELGVRLEAHGLPQTSEMPGMAVDLAALPSPVAVPGLRIERVADARALDRWCEAYIAGFEMEAAAGRSLADVYARIRLADNAPVRHYVGWLDGRAVASSSVVFAAGVAGVFHVGTLPQARRRGIGGAMTLAPLLEARDLGYEVGVLFASTMGEPVYRRLGFRACSTLRQFRWAPGGAA